MNKNFIKNIFSTAANLARFEPMDRHHIQNKLISAHSGKNPNYSAPDAVREYNKSMQKTVANSYRTCAYGIGLTIPLAIFESLFQRLAFTTVVPTWEIIPQLIPATSLHVGLAAFVYATIMVVKAGHLESFRDAGAKRVINRMVKQTAKRLERNQQSLLTQNPVQ